MLLIMKKAWIVLLSVFAFVSCNFFEFNFHTNESYEVDYKLLASELFDQNGGELSIEGITIIIPPGVFNETTELKLYVGNGKNEFLDFSNSMLYQLQGLPDLISQPITITMDCEKKPMGDPLLAIGELHYSSSIDSIVFAYNIVPAKYNNKQLTYTFETGTNLKSVILDQNVQDNVINFIALNSFTSLKSSAEHFEIAYPLMYEKQAKLLGTYFEDAYTICKNLGFDYTGRDWPIKVNILAIPYKNPGIYSPHFFQNSTDAEIRSLINKGLFTINLNMVNDKELMQQVSIHEFLHFVQNVYEFSAPFVMPEQGWLKEATSVWIQSKVSPNPNDVPVQFKVYNSMYPFFGLNYYSDKISHAIMGYGLSTYIKDISQIEGDKAILGIFEKIKNGTLPNNAVNPIDAIQSVLIRPLDKFVYGVMVDYTLGNYYNSKQNFSFLDDPLAYKVLFNIDEAHHSFSQPYNYHDLSGKFFKITAENIKKMTDDPLSISVTDPATSGLTVFKFKKSKEIAMVGEAIPGSQGKVILEDWKTIFNDGYELVVLVSNTKANPSTRYQTISEIVLNIETGSNVKPINFAEITILLDDAERMDVYLSDTNNPVIRTGIGFGIDTRYTGVSSFQNNVYSAVWNDEVYVGDTYNGNIMLTLQVNPKRINLDLNLTISQPGSFNKNITIKMEDIPIFNEGQEITDGETYIIDTYEERGSSVSRIEFEYFQENYNSMTMELLNTNCGEDASIRIRTWTEK